MIRPDGTLVPCFGMLSNYDQDWGRIWEPKFDPVQLAEMKKECLPKCSSTCFYTMALLLQQRDPGRVGEKTHSGGLSFRGCLKKKFLLRAAYFSSSFVGCPNRSSTWPNQACVTI